MGQVEQLNLRGRIPDHASSLTSLGRFIAQPQHRLGNTFASALRAAGGTLDVASSLTGVRGLGSVTGLAGVDGQYADILQQQMEMQRQMMTVSMISNVERTRHETNMAGVRNMRVA